VRRHFGRRRDSVQSESSAAGYVDGIDDPGMGWARYAQTIRIFVLNSGLFYIQPSERTVRCVQACAALMSSEQPRARMTAEPDGPHHWLPEDCQSLGSDGACHFHASPPGHPP
jgi:hypothetical protein